MAEATELFLAGNKSGIINCLTIPLHHETILLPNTAIAEVVAYQVPEVIENAPEWFLGQIIWRDYRVPLISFEALSGLTVRPARIASQIAIVNTISGNALLPYLGLLTQSIPSLTQVNENRLKAKSSGDNQRQSILAMVELNGTELLIPDIDDMEQRLKRLQF